MPTIGFPLLLIPLALYNIIIFLMPDVAFTAPVATLPLLSGAAWTVTLGDVLVALGVVLLLFEMVKAARPGAKYLTDHLLSLIVAGGAAAEFVLLKPFATSAFFLLTLLAGIDFLGGASIALRWRKVRRAAVVPAAPVVPAAVEPPLPTPAARVEPVIAPVAGPAPQSPSVVEVPPQDNMPVRTEHKASDRIESWNVSEIVSGIETPHDKAGDSQAPKTPESQIEPKPSDKI